MGFVIGRFDCHGGTIAQGIKTRYLAAMPELPEVETVCRGLRPKLEGRVLARVEQRRPDLRIPFPPDFATRLTGRRITAIRRRAKYILMDLDDGWVLVVHLGMSGRMCIHPSPGGPPGRHDHVLLHTDDGTTVVFNDTRRFGLMTLIQGAALDEHPLFRDLGPEPLGNAFNGPGLSAAVKGRKTSIKAALLDQKVVVGVGNIYACESLFRAGISPKRLAASVAGRRAERLASAVKAVLNDAIEAGGSSLRDYVQASGELGYFQHRFAVYDREGQPCPGCDCPAAKGAGPGILRIVQAGRSTYYCPRKQR
jgi:formamidopyrimidine-DNA glycosylase